MARDEFGADVIRALSRRTGQCCSNQNCGKPTSGLQPSNFMGVINIGVAAHITAAAPGGKRYDALLTPDERRAPKNGIWLCQNCGKLIDSDEITYSVSVLRGWKDQAERRAFEAISGHPKNAVAILERRLSGHTNMVWDVAVTPDGQRIVSASNDESVKVWDSASGAVLFTLTGHESFVCSLSVASNGSQLATGAMDGRIIIWNLFNADCLARLDHGAADAKVSWKPNASVLISGGADGRLCGW